MAKKQYNGAKASILVAAAAAVLLGSAWLANQPATVTQAAGTVPSGAASTTISAAPAATSTSSPRPVIKATKSRGS